MNTISNKICSIDGCSGKHRARGFCCRHYFQYREDEKMSGGWVNLPKEKHRLCTIAGCGKKHLAGGMCSAHYTQEIKKRNRQFILDRYFPNGVVCRKCNKQFELVQMDAHHPDPEVKEHTLSVLLNNSALQERPELIAELDQCEMVCTRCHQNIHHDPLKTHEETYQRKDKGRRVDEMKKVIREMFGDKCMECGDVLLPKEMEFHHRNPEEKVDNVSDLMRIASRDEVIEEVKKCDVVCRNCHRLKLEMAA